MAQRIRMLEYTSTLVAGGFGLIPFPSITATGVFF